MRVSIYIAIGILLLSPMRVRADERGYGNRLPYWSPPVHKELPKTWGWTRANPGKDEYSLGDSTFLPGSRWVESKKRRNGVGSRFGAG